MFKVKQIVLYLLLVTLFSCQRNPLENRSYSQFEGVLKTGSQNSPIFDQILINKILKLNIEGEQDLRMNFYEGRFQKYNIHFRLLNDFSSKYEVRLKDNPFSQLEDSKWSYDSKTQTGVLKWTPSETFNGKENYKLFSIILPIELKKLGHPEKGSTLNVLRKIIIAVVKNNTAPNIFKVQTKYDSYIKLDDGHFYRDYMLANLDLSYYDVLFLGSKNFNQKVDKNLIFYTNDIYWRFKSIKEYEEDKKSALGFGMVFDKFKLTNKINKEIPVHLIPFVRQSYYKAIPTKEGKCKNNQISKQNDSLCFSPIEDLSSVAFTDKIYIKHYKTPPNIDRADLYYKVDSSVLCGIYYDTLGSDFIIHNKKWVEKDSKKSCYLSLNKLYLYVQSQKRRFFIDEKTDIYAIKKSGNSSDVIELDKSQWEVSFYRLPEYVKWQLAGHQPILDNTIPFYLLRQNISNLSNIKYDRDKKSQPIAFFIKDINYTGSPFLEVIESEDDIPPWQIPFKFISVPKGYVNNTNWKIAYNIQLENSLLEKNSGNFEEYSLKFQPVSSNVGEVGKPVKINFFVLPFIQLKYNEIFDPLNSLKLKNSLISTNNFVEWRETTLSIKTQIRQDYIFPPKFKENLLKILPWPKSINNLEDILNIDFKPVSNYGCDSDSFFKESFCECSKISYHEIEETENSIEQSSASAVCSYY
ncbi:MAG: hypothetical protein OXC37_04965, partial [Bdellovibrionaceae bacterium]|nr:hypothetical protein [Pseudobdellovibrionaceae bacterium]